MAITAREARQTPKHHIDNKKLSYEELIVLGEKLWNRHDMDHKVKTQARAGRRNANINFSIDDFDSIIAFKAYAKTLGYTCEQLNLVTKAYILIHW